MGAAGEHTAAPGRESPLQRGWGEGGGHWEADANEGWRCFPREMVIFIGAAPPGAWGLPEFPVTVPYHKLKGTRGSTLLPV